MRSRSCAPKNARLHLLQHKLLTKPQESSSKGASAFLPKQKRDTLLWFSVELLPFSKVCVASVVYHGIAENTNLFCKVKRADGCSFRRRARCPHRAGKRFADLQPFGGMRACRPTAILMARRRGDHWSPVRVRCASAVFGRLIAAPTCAVHFGDMRACRPTACFMVRRRGDQWSPVRVRALRQFSGG